MKRFGSFLTLLIALSSAAIAQTSDEDIDALLGDDEPKYAEKTFYGTRVVNSHSIENLEAKTMDFRINHRFGTIENGIYDMFGLDQATMRLGFDYGLTDNLQIGIGRSTFEKTYDGFIKYRFMRQQTGKKNIPVGMAYVAGMSVNTLKWFDPTRQNFFSSRFAYSHELIVARKFNDNFSLQLMPTLVHRNLIDSSIYKHDVFAMGVAVKQKVGSIITLDMEYFYLLPNQVGPNYKSSLSLGIDISTGDHVFQLHFTNSTGTFEKAYITQTTNSWLKGQIHFGFNLVRKFHFDHSW